MRGVSLVPLLLSQSCWVESNAYNQIFSDGHISLCLLPMFTSTIWSAYWTFFIVSGHAYCHVFDKRINKLTIVDKEIVKHLILQHGCKKEGLPPFTHVGLLRWQLVSDYLPLHF